MIIDSKKQIDHVRIKWENETEIDKRDIVRKRRSVTSDTGTDTASTGATINEKFNFYSRLAHNTGGQLFIASLNETDISDTASVMDSLLSTSRVLLFKYSNVSSRRLLRERHQFPVDPAARSCTC